MHILYNALASSSTHQSMKAPGLVDADANSQHRWAMVHKFMRLCWALFHCHPHAGGLGGLAAWAAYARIDP